jgi:hypothetical protein
LEDTPPTCGLRYPQPGLTPSQPISGSGTLTLERRDGRMAVDERARHELHGRLAEVLAREEATTLMSLLPPVGWGRSSGQQA